MLTAVVTLLGGWRATAFAALALLALSGTGAQTIRLHRAQSDAAILRSAAAEHAALDAAAVLTAETNARATERRQSDALRAAEAKHAEELTHANETAATVADGLRTGALRLRSELTACRASTGVLSGPPAAPTDASAELRAAVARTVAVGARCDADIRALQAVVKADRE